MSGKAPSNKNVLLILSFLALAMKRIQPQLTQLIQGYAEKPDDRVAAGECVECVCADGDGLLAVHVCMLTQSFHCNLHATAAG